MNIWKVQARLAVAGHLFLLCGTGLTFAAEPLVEQDISKVDVPCSDSDSELGIGVRNCKTVKKDAKDYLRKVVGHMVYNFYEGKILAFDQKKGFCVQSRFSAPVCALGDVASPEENTNRKAQSCSGAVTKNEGYCEYPIRSDFKNCSRERIWLLNGGRVQAMQHHLEEVENEIENNELKLGNWSADPASPARMCIGYARAINRLLHGDDKKAGLKFADKFVRDKFPAAELNTQLAEACPREGLAMSPDVDTGVTERAPASTGAEPSFFSKLGIKGKLAEVFGFAKAETNKPSLDLGNGTLSQKKGVSHAACHLAYARQNIEVLFYKLAACEVSYRSQKNYYENFERSEGAFAALDSAVVKPCLSHAREATMSASDNMSDDAFKSKYYECYKGKIAGKKGAKQVLKEYFDLYAPVENAVPYESLAQNEEACS